MLEIPRSGERLLAQCLCSFSKLDGRSSKIPKAHKVVKPLAKHSRKCSANKIANEPGLQQPSSNALNDAILGTPSVISDTIPTSSQLPISDFESAHGEEEDEDQGPVASRRLEHADVVFYRLEIERLENENRALFKLLRDELRSILGSQSAFSAHHELAESLVNH